MDDVLIVNQSRPLSAPLKAGYCVSFWCRLKGLMFQRNIPEDWGLLLVYSRDSRTETAIHMLFVPFDLGVVCINKAGEVVDTTVARKWIGLKSPKHPASYILEIVPQRINEFRIGDKVTFENIA